MQKSFASCGLIAGLLVLFAMNSSFAMPTVGDDVIFSSVRVNAGAVITVTFEMKLISYDSASGKWTERQTTTENGVSKVENDQVLNSALLTDAGVATLLANCVSMSGTLQTVTVPAGTFSTCAVASNSAFSNGTLWIAKGVVFGVVQEDFTQADGTHTVLQLVSQTAGQ
jgi:hypothetical protein